MIKTNQLLYKIINKDENNKVISERTILNDINIHIEKGEFVAILGHNGSGKTTFAKHLNALLLPSEGSVLIDGKDTNDVDELWKIRKACGMVFQNPDNQIVGTTVEEDVAFGPENLGLATDKIIKRVDSSLEKTGMSKYRFKSPNHLSGGQKQRVAIASALAMRPECIVFDEATAMLDPKGRKEVMDIISKLNEEENMTIILITHHMEEAKRAKRIVVMEKGRPILDGTPKEIFSQIDEIKRLGIDVPQIMDLSYRLWEKGKLSRFDVLDVDEFVKLYKAENPKKIEKSLNQAKICGLNKEDGNKEDGNKEDGNKEESIKEDVEILRLENVSYVYEAGTNMEIGAVKDVSLSINKNEFIGIIGHTGSGKSTILQLLNGLIKPSAGNVFFDGKDIYSDINLNSDLKNNKKIKRNKRNSKKNKDLEERNTITNLHFKVGIVFQYPESQLFEETVIKDVMYGPLNKGLSENDARKVAEKALEFLGMGEEYYHRSPFELSGGEMRKVAIAGVIAMEPEVIILDEPVAGLDPANKKYLLEALKSLQKEKNKTIIMVSHDMNDVAKYAERVIGIDEGKIRFDGDTRSVFRNSLELKEMGLVAPEVTIAVDRLIRDGYLKRDDYLKREDYVKREARNIVDLKSESSKDCTVLTLEEAVNYLS